MTPRANKSLPQAEAARLWELYALTSPKELVLEDLAMAQNIFVQDARLDSSHARLVRQGEFGLIRVSDRLTHPGQRRFAIAHEIGHFLMHRQITQLLACTDKDMHASYKSGPYEIEASSFAAALLMPEKLFLKEAKGTNPDTDTIKQLASYFDTSLTATALRYVDTSSDYCVFVVSEANTIRWWRASDRFQSYRLWLDNRDSLPKYSAASEYFKSGTIHLKPVKVDLADWFGDQYGIESDYLYEQAIPIPLYNQVISLLWLP